MCLWQDGWETHLDYGQQFKVVHVKIEMPSGAKGWRSLSASIRRGRNDYILVNRFQDELHKKVSARLILSFASGAVSYFARKVCSHEISGENGREQ